MQKIKLGEAAAFSTLADPPLPPAYRCENLGVVFSTPKGEFCVLDNVNLSISQGEFVSIVGPSGTGKTTLLKAFGGLVPVTAKTELKHSGQNIDGPPDGVAFVFQNYNSSLLPWRTVAKNVSLGIESSVPRAHRPDRIRSALDAVGLTHRADELPWRLSGGMQQRVQIARALAMKPDVMLMDEPFGALDAMTKGQLQDELQRLHHDTGATFVFVTHDIDEAVYLSDRIVALSGTPSTVAQEFVIDLPRPRHLVSTRELPRYLELRREVYEAVHTETAPSA